MGQPLVGVDYRDKWQPGLAAWRPCSKQAAGIKLGVQQFQESGRAAKCRWLDADDLRQEALIAVWQDAVSDAARSELSRFTAAKNRARWSLLTMAAYLLGESRGVELPLDDIEPEDWQDKPDFGTPEALARVADALQVLAGMSEPMRLALKWQQGEQDVQTQARAAGVNPQVAWHRIRTARAKLEAVL